MGLLDFLSPAASIPKIDPHFGQDMVKNLITPAEEPKKKNFWDFLGNTVGGLLDTVGKGGTLIDLSKAVKLPTVSVDAGSKTMNWIKIIAIGLGVFLLISLFRGKRK